MKIYVKASKKNRVMASKFDKYTKYDDDFKSNVIGRMIADVKYWINSGKSKGLTYKDHFWWAGSIDEQIEALRLIYDSYEDKDDLIVTQDDIDYYISEMEKAVRDRDEEEYAEAQRQDRELFERNAPWFLRR